jgi:hypothetical protein
MLQSMLGLTEGLASARLPLWLGIGGPKGSKPLHEWDAPESYTETRVPVARQVVKAGRTALS